MSVFQTTMVGMSVFNFSRLLSKSTWSIGLRTVHGFSSSGKLALLFHDKIKFKIHNNSSYDDKFNKCIKSGLSSNTVYTNPWIFDIEIDSLTYRLELLQKWNPKTMDDLFILLQMPTPRLKFVTNRMRQESSIVPHGNRVYYLATTFEKNPQEVCNHMMQYKFLFTRKFSILQQILCVLLENDVHINDIWNDMWVFMYSMDQITQRIKHIKAAKVVTKPWMLRCKAEVLERTLEIKQENRVVLNKDSTTQYLAKRLKVSEKTISYISSKYPTTLRVSPTKLKEILDFLLREGYKPSQILKIPRVFTHSISTLQERLNELRDLGYEPTLTALCKNKTTYQELVDKLILKNTKN